MRVLLLGAGGFIGSRLLSRLRNLQCNILATTHNKRLAIQEQLLLFDILDTSSLNEKFDLFRKFEPELIVNCIMFGVSPRDRTEITHESDQLVTEYVEKLIHVTQSLSAQNSTRLIHFATRLTLIENERDRYVSLSRRCEFLLTQELSPENMTVVRLPRIYGPNEPNGRFIADLVNEMISTGRVTVKQPCRQRAYIHVDHLVDAIVDWVMNGVSTEIETLRIRNIDVAYSIARVVSREPHICIELNHAPTDSPLRECQDCGPFDDGHSLVVGVDPSIYVKESVGFFQDTIQKMVIELEQSRSKRS